MDVDQAPMSAPKDAPDSHESHLDSNSNRAKPPPADSASPQEQPSSSFKESRDNKRPKLDPESLPPPALPPFKQDNAPPPPTPNSTTSSALGTSSSAKSPAASTPSSSTGPGPKPFPVVTVRTVATPKPPGPPQREPSTGSQQQQQQQSQQSQQASQSALGNSATSNGRPTSGQGRPRSISPNVSTKQPHKDSSRPSAALGPGSASSSRGGSPEMTRKSSHNGGSALPHSTGSKKNAAPFSASNHKSRDAADKSRDNSPALAIKAEQAAALAAEPLRKGRGKSPVRGTIDNDDCVVLKGHLAQVTPCSWNPKVPSMVATGAYDGTARIWDVPDVSGSSSGQVIDESVVAKHGSKNKRIEVGVVAWNVRCFPLTPFSDLC